MKTKITAILLTAIMLAVMFPASIFSVSAETSAPTVSRMYAGTVVLENEGEYEYSKDGTVWQRDNIFTGLDAETTYTFYRRAANNDGGYAGEKSAGLQVSVPNYGDINSDNNVDTLDLIRLKKYLVGIETSVDTDMADLRYDGTVNVIDIVRFKNYLAGKNVYLHALEQNDVNTDRELFVFAGQSNAQGASPLEPSNPSQIVLNNSYEYLHKAKRFGNSTGTFKNTGFPAGEFSYKNLSSAYSSLDDFTVKSTLTSYASNAYFAPSMSNYEGGSKSSLPSFSTYSESTARPGASLAPTFAAAWEELGYKSSYAHIAKGSTSILYYFNSDMLADYNARVTEYNTQNGTSYKQYSAVSGAAGASAYFDEKATDFFADTASYFPNDNMSEKCFVWIQGESDSAKETVEYKLMMDVLWEHMKSLGFTRFFCIRVGYWDSTNHDKMSKIMQAQEDFCNAHTDTYMMTRTFSFIPFDSSHANTTYFTSLIPNYTTYRDSFSGYGNYHLNQAGMQYVISNGVINVERVLKLGLDAVPETEMVKALIK